MLGIDIAAADSNSDCSPIRLRSRQVSCMIGSTPAAIASRLPAQLDSRTTALWLSVMLTAVTQSRTASTLRVITCGSALRGGPISAVTVNAPRCNDAANLLSESPVTLDQSTPAHRAPASTRSMRSAPTAGDQQDVAPRAGQRSGLGS